MSARIIPDITPEQYHADPCAVPSLSSSCAGTIISKSPFHAWLSHPRLGKLRREPTDSMERGTLIHELSLGRGHGVSIIEAEDYRTKAAKEARDAARAAKLLPVLRAAYDDADAVARDVRLGIRELGIELSGTSEVAVEWTEPSEYGPVTCRGMMDHLILDRGLIYDLKTSHSAHPRACISHVYEYGYDIQCAAYTSAVRQLRPALAGREEFMFLFIEELPAGAPRRALVVPTVLDGTFRELGERRWRRAVDTWARCTRDDHWPAYTAAEPTRLEAPAWALAQEVM